MRDHAGLVTLRVELQNPGCLVTVENKPGFSVYVVSSIANMSPPVNGERLISHDPQRAAQMIGMPNDGL